MPSSFAVGQFVKEERPAGSDTKYDKRMYASLFFNPEAMGDVVKNENGMEEAVLWSNFGMAIAVK